MALGMGSGRESVHLDQQHVDDRHDHRARRDMAYRGLGVSVVHFAGLGRRQHADRELARRRLARLDRRFVLPHHERRGFRGHWFGGGVVVRRIEVQTQIPLPLGVFVFFPILLLSTLETQSPLVPISPIVLRSLFAELVDLGGVLLRDGLCRRGSRRVALADQRACGTARTSAAPGPMSSCWSSRRRRRRSSSAAMVYFRLLGRLAWVCAEDLRAAQKEDEDFDERRER